MKVSLGGYEHAVRSRMALLAPAIGQIWSHDAPFWGDDAERCASVANRLGWLDVVDLMLTRVDEIDAFSAEVQAAGFRDAVVLGMGGSSLAPEVMRRSITEQLPKASAPRLHVLDTTDPETILEVKEGIDVASTLFFVSSKSGTTIEASCLLAYFHQLVVDAKGAAAGENFVAITDEGTPLHSLAQRQGFRRLFLNPPDIGGRYSALSYFGLVPAGVAGMDTGRILASAARAVEQAKHEGSNAVLLGVAISELAELGRDKCTFLLSPGIASFGLWVEQLIAESTGKEGLGVLPVAGEPLVEAERYKPDRVFVQIRLVGDDNARLDQHAAAVEAAGHPVIRIDLADPYDLGAEFFRWEFAVAIAGRVLGINPFDEPNVQESKDNTNRMLVALDETGSIPIDAIDCGDDLLPALGRLSLALASAGYFAITAYTPSTATSSAEFALIRRAVSEQFGMATTLGYGPRFLHSTGQFHKGGPHVGAFLQVLGQSSANADSATPDIAIPGKPFTFGQLKCAQAAGDRESLLRRGASVVTVTIGARADDLAVLRQRMVEALNAHAARGR